LADFEGSQDGPCPLPYIRETVQAHAPDKNVFISSRHLTAAIGSHNYHCPNKTSTNSLQIFEFDFTHNGYLLSGSFCARTIFVAKKQVPTLMPPMQ
jgi:hypothetical protein